MELLAPNKASLPAIKEDRIMVIDLISPELQTTLVMCASVAWFTWLAFVA
jgi:hypothetical protein